MDVLTADDPRSVGEFRLLARLGSGGMGQVFLASSLAGRSVAVKVIHPEFCRDPDFLLRFRHEVEAAQKVSGWYTAPVVAAGVDDRPPWLATAFVSGPSLEDIVTRYGPLPVPAVWRLAAGLAEALRAIHATGLVHRDLKPGNVLLAPDGPRVIDFGISRAISDTRLTATGAVIGTPSYMSPEQVEGLETGPASDTFSLGSVLAFAASGAAPYSGAPGGSAASVMYRVVHTEPNLAAVPAEVRGLVAACLAKDWRQRPDLGRFAAHSTAAAERLGLSPAAFWPPEVARVIQAQQAALTAQIEALRVAPATYLDDAYRANGTAATPPGRMVPSHRAGRTSGRPSDAGPLDGETHPAGGTGPADGTAPGARAAHGQLATATTSGSTRRGLLIGAGVGGITVIGGAVGWALNSRSTPNGQRSSGPGATGPASGPSGLALPTGQALQPYYGAGPRRTATWKFATGNGIEASPGAAGGMAYVGSTDNNVYAVDIATGRKAWSFQAGAVTAAPQVIGDVVCLSSADGHFHALSAASGRRVWDTSSVPTLYNRTWAVDGGNVIVGAETTPPRAYDAATGAKGASFSMRVPYTLALTAASGVLYALNALGILYAFRTASGAEIWHRQLLSVQEEQPGTGLLVGGGTIYLGTLSGTLYAIDATSGKTLWTYRPGGGIDSGMAISQGVLYLKDNKGTVHAINAANAKPVWTRVSVISAPWGVTVAAGRVYYTTVLAVQALDAKSGSPVWSFVSPDNSAFQSTPAVASGLVFVGSYDNSLYAIPA
jgi:outer membrane protein assembly factor BamB